MSEDEAARLRAADPGQRDDMIRRIQLTHARTRLDAAVDDGRVNGDEADEILDRLSNGGSPRLLGRLRPRLQAASVVTLESTVRGETGGAPTGTVTFRDGTTPLATVPSTRRASPASTPTSGGAGAHYGGDTHFSPSNTQTVHQVERAATSAVISASVPPEKAEQP